MPNYVSLRDAREILPDAQRVLVIGCSGGGKTTLSLDIAKTYIWRFERQSAPGFVMQFDRYGARVPVVTLRSRRDFAQLL